MCSLRFFKWLPCSSVIFVLMLLVGCNRGDFECEDAVIHVSNPAKDPDSIIIYGWGTSFPEDTLWPRETAEYHVGYVASEGGLFSGGSSSSSEIVTFSTINGDYTFEVDECEKRVDAPGGYVYLKQYCNNGIADYDEGELGVDCGGYCDECPDVEAPCYLHPNMISWEKVSEFDGSVEDYYASSSFGYIGLSIGLDNQNFVEVTFNMEEMPEGSCTLLTTESSNDGEVRIRYITGGGATNTYTGKSDHTVYLNKVSSTSWTLEFCDVEFRTLFDDDLGLVKASFDFTVD